MHFTLSNLLHDFSNNKCMLFSLLKKKKIIWKYGSTLPDLQPNWSEPVFNLLKMTYFDQQPIWLTIKLTWPELHPTRPFYHVHEHQVHTIKNVGFLAVHASHQYVRLMWCERVRYQVQNIMFQFYDLWHAFYQKKRKKKKEDVTCMVGLPQ